jgi:hypothetical protein
MSFRLPVLLLFLFLSVVSAGQFKKGNRMTGLTVGTAFFNSGNADVSYPAPTTGYTAKTTNFGLAIQPSLGWFITDNTAVGVSLNINPTSSKLTKEAGGTTYEKDKTNSFNFGIGGFARSYFSNFSSFLPFGQFSLNVGMSSLSNEGFIYNSDIGGSYKQTYSGKSSGGFFTNATLSAGFTKLLNSHTGLDFYAGYTFSFNKNTSKTTLLKDYGNNGSIEQTIESEPTTKFTSHGFMIGVGFQIFLGPRKK